jgi:DNA-binding NarL/FixJ family response regulator
LIAKAITSIIEGFKGYEVLYECENGKEPIERFADKRNIPDIVLLDISMPEMDGKETALWLRENHPAVLVMALTMQGDDNSLISMIKSGAKGYLHKNIHPRELEKALQMLVQNKIYYPDWATSRVFRAIAHQEAEQTPDIIISEREKEFLRHACTELTYKQIGEKMFCSARTVESYRDSLFEKLGLKTRVGLALYAVKAGLHTL